jgi:hypothetical protein
MRKQGGDAGCSGLCPKPLLRLRQAEGFTARPHGADVLVGGGRLTQGPVGGVEQGAKAGRLDGVGTGGGDGYGERAGGELGLEAGGEGRRVKGG